MRGGRVGSRWRGCRKPCEREEGGRKRGEATEKTGEETVCEGGRGEKENVRPAVAYAYTVLTQRSLQRFLLPINGIFYVLRR